MQVQDRDREPSMPIAIALLAFAGAAAALVGGYWDDAWHTERGRDAFFIAPHIAIYAGIATAGGALSLWALLTARRLGTRAVWSHKPLVLALLSVSVTLAAGPIDNAWHLAFGRDSVIWSPPHMLGIVGTMALGASILAELAGRAERWTGWARPVAGALVLAAACFATVEYDTDVPQFDEAFYLPVLGTAACIGLLLVRAASDERWAATAAAALYTAFIGAVGLFLSAVGFPPPALPLLIAAAAVIDVADRRAWSPIPTAAAFTAAIYLVYVPVRNGLGDAVYLDAADVGFGGVLTFASTTILLAALSPRGLRPRRRQLLVGSGTAAALIAVAAVATAPRALAHDPGQGEDAGSVDLRVAAAKGRAVLTADLTQEVCETTEPVAVVARRAGEVIRGPLGASGCRLRGSVPLTERGRWFVYAEMSRDGRTVEAWLPVALPPGHSVATEKDRYAYFPPERSSSVIKFAGGVVLYGAMVALLYAAFALVAASRRERGGPARPAT